MQKQCFSSLPLDVKGHVRIADDLGNILVDSDNAVHPQNMARVIARALANESNYYVYRIAFGNGGTTVDAAYTITYNPPHDGQSPDTKTWDSRLYKETYSEIVDDNDHLAEMGVDPGSAGDEEGQRPGGGSVPADDPPTVPNVSGPGVFSNELGLTSEVVVYCVLNPNEPKSEYLTDTLAPTESTDTSFTFDEIGLYTLGAAGIDTGGYQNIDVGTKLSTDVITGFAAGNAYSFDVAVDGAAPVTVGFTVISPLSGSGGASEILFGDLCEALNQNAVGSFNGINVTTPLPSSVKLEITDNSTGSFPSITGAITYGYLRFIRSGAAGATTSVDITNAAAFLADLTPTGGTLETAVSGADAGIQNDPVNPTTERERLLTHIIFSPVLKSANRTLSITYTLTISVARTVA